MNSSRYLKGFPNTSKEKMDILSAKFRNYLANLDGVKSWQRESLLKVQVHTISESASRAMGRRQAKKSLFIKMET